MLLPERGCGGSEGLLRPRSVELERESRVRSLLGDEGSVRAACEGDEVELVLDTTPFYAEGGGQLPDLGLITVGSGVAEVLDVQQPVPGLIVHRVKVVSGEKKHGLYLRLLGEGLRVARSPVDDRIPGVKGP